MSIKSWNVFYFFMLILTLSSSSVYSLEVETHEAINRAIAQQTINGFSLDSYLKNTIGISGGVEELFNNTTVYDSFKLGGRYEDKPPEWYSIPYVRSLNHFHNPMNKQGYGIGDSAIRWSQRDPSTQSPGGYFSWHDVRDYFWKALTLPAKSDRDTKFADTFRGLGQLMHLVQDMSVPEHSRNDGHVLYCFENWIRDVQQGKKPQWKPIYDNALAYPTFFNKDALPLVSKITDAPVPIANLFDTNQYNGSNPDVTLRDDIGLSEYSNANFMSPDTMFSSAFPYPNWSNVVIDYNKINNFTGRGTTYLRKLGKDEAEGGKTGNGVHVEHLAAARWGYNLLPSWLQQNGLFLKMDDEVYADYARLLLPRAVGYSAGLLSYFFRGQIDMIPDVAAGSGYVIVNNTDEAMSGKFELYYDNINGQRILLNPGGWTLDINNKNSSNNKSTNVYFTPPPPAQAKEPGKYILVFRGTLGNEDDAVVGDIVDGYVCACIQDDVGDLNPDRPIGGSFLYVYKSGNMNKYQVFAPAEIEGRYGRSSKIGMHNSGLVAAVSMGYVDSYEAVHFKVSTDFGKTWGSTVILDSGLWYAGADVKIDDKGVIYVVVADFGYQWGPSYYNFYWMYSTDKGQTWTKSVVFVCPYEGYAEDVVMDITGSVLTNDLRIAVNGASGPPTYTWVSDRGWVWLGDAYFDYTYPWPHGPYYGGTNLSSGVNRNTFVTIGTGTVDYPNKPDGTWGGQDFWTIVFRNGSKVYETSPRAEPNNIVWQNGGEAFQQTVVRSSGDVWAITALGLFNDGSSYYGNWDGKEAAVLMSFDDGVTWQIIPVTGCTTQDSDWYGYRFVDIKDDTIFFGYNPERGTMKLFAGTIDKVQKTVQWSQVYSAPAFGGFHMGDAKIVRIQQ